MGILTTKKIIPESEQNKNNEIEKVGMFLNVMEMTEGGDVLRSIILREES